MKKIIKILLCRFLGLITSVKRAFNKGNTNTILIIKQDGIGDFVLFLPIAEEIRKYYSEKKIIFCCSPLTKEMALSSGFFDETICFSRKDFDLLNICKTFRLFSRVKCDLLLHPTQPRTVEAEIVAYWINAKEKIASLGEAGALPMSAKHKFDKIYNKLIDTGERNMTLIQSANFVRKLGDIDFKVSLPVITNIQTYPICLPENFFVVFLGGSVFNKLWPPERFHSVAEYIVNKTTWKCFVCGTEKDIQQLGCFNDSGIEYYSLLGKTSINELIYVLSKAKLVIGNDTCAIHIANAVRVPSICVKGQFSGEKFFPYKVETKTNEDILPYAVSSDVKCKWCTLRNGGYFCLHGDYFAHKKVKCLMHVNVETVIETVDNVLNQYYKNLVDIEE